MSFITTKIVPITLFIIVCSSSNVSDNAEIQEVPVRAVHLALRAGEMYIRSKAHDDIENSDLHLVRKLMVTDFVPFIEFQNHVHTAARYFVVLVMM